VEVQATLIAILDNKNPQFPLDRSLDPLGYSREEKIPRYFPEIEPQFFSYPSPSPVNGLSSDGPVYGTVCQCLHRRLKI